MTDKTRHDDLQETKEIELPTPEKMVDYVVARLHLYVEVCEGIDEATLRLLASKTNDGRTVLQSILGQVSWTNLPTQA